eukprot:TRINITY_DN10511_c0_g1_i3.p1 TRINITY_DN10511_c0_g1~~TRINITY_DN10511_c0_g1_i3.p1  ORF type:complete len:175 (+),score=32.36 TRINITY_DN10511_c0_g1_i3:349-873(+)
MFQQQVLLLLHPRTSIKIFVHLINEDGSELSCCCNAISMALTDAGIPLRSSLASVDVAIMSNGTLVADPTKEVVLHRKLNEISFSYEKQIANGKEVPFVTALSSFQVNTAGKIVSEWSHAVTPPEDTDSGLAKIDEDLYLSARGVARVATTKIHNFMRLTTTAKCLYECHGTAF